MYKYICGINQKGRIARSKDMCIKIWGNTVKLPAPNPMVINLSSAKCKSVCFPIALSTESTLTFWSFVNLIGEKTESQAHFNLTISRCVSLSLSDAAFYVNCLFPSFHHFSVGWSFSYGLLRTLYMREISYKYFSTSIFLSAYVDFFFWLCFGFSQAENYF